MALGGTLSLTDRRFRLAAPRRAAAIAAAPAGERFQMLNRASGNNAE